MSGSGGGKGSGSVYSTPITSSPSFGREGRGGEEVMGSGTLWPKGLGKTGKMWNETRRESYGSPSPLGKGFAGSVLGGGGGLLGGDGSVLGTNERSPSARGAAVGLNSKWLFQKGRSMSGSRGPSMYL